VGVHITISYLKVKDGKREGKEIRERREKEKGIITHNHIDGKIA